MVIMETRSSFADTYQHMADVQLLKIANEGGMVPEAKQALTDELNRRKLKASDLPHYQPSKQERLEKETRERQLPLGRGFNGFGLYGRTYLSDAERNAHTYVRTKFFVLASIPLVPIASYRFRLSGEDEQPLGRVPLLWRQVVVTWLKTLLVIVGIIVAVAAYIWVRAMWSSHSSQP
jgi:hypothetical protein